MLTTGKTAVFSDIHFGTQNCSIGTWYEGTELQPKAKGQRVKFISSLIKYLEQLGNVNRIILLGDIFDLHLSNFSTSFKASELFFNKICDLNKLSEIVYIPGNHDHLIWLLHMYHNNAISKISNANIRALQSDFRVCSRQLSGENVFLGTNSFLSLFFNNKKKQGTLNVKICYPYLAENIGPDENIKKYFFTHGHFFDGQQRVSYESLKILYPIAKFFLKLKARGANIGDCTLDELELYCSPLFSLFNALGHTQAGRDRMNEIYNRFREEISNDDINLDSSKLKVKIKKFISLCSQDFREGAGSYYDEMDYLIFGHTHHLAINRFYYTPKRIKAINIGCWLIESDIVGSFLVIDHSKFTPQLMIMENNGTIKEHWASIKLQQGAIPKQKPKLFFRGV